MPNNVLRLSESGLISDKKGYDTGDGGFKTIQSQLPVKCLNIGQE